MEFLVSCVSFLTLSLVYGFTFCLCFFPSFLITDCFHLLLISFPLCLSPPYLPVCCWAFQSFIVFSLYLRTSILISCLLFVLGLPLDPVNLLSNFCVLNIKFFELLLHSLSLHVWVSVLFVNLLDTYNKSWVFLYVMHIYH